MEELHKKRRLFEFIKGLFPLFPQKLPFKVNVHRRPASQLSKQTSMKYCRSLYNRSGMGISTLLTIYFVIFSSSILHGVVPVKAKLLNHIHCFEYVENVADLKTYICKKTIENFVYDKFYPHIAFFIKLFCA